MSIWNGDASDFYALANDLSQVGAKAVKPLRGVMDEVGQKIEDQWRENAEGHFDGHARNYPKAINHRPTLGMSSVGTEVFPDPAKSNQAFLGPILEFGGERSPAYLDGARALESMEGKAEQMVATALGHLFDE